MWHGNINAVYSNQGDPRGTTQTFSQSMLMGMGQRALGGGTFAVRGMVSLDPLMGKNGYPLLFQSGETANGQDHLVDRQHPHDLLMELSASYSKFVADEISVFGYIGLPGEPALGPTAFMHRDSGKDNPEAPITHHWLDSTHITFGVLTGGVIWRNVKLEASAFHGREPDQFRYNIETGKLDSASARLSWNPIPAWSLQVSHGYLASPEQLDAEVALRRTTASASFQNKFGSTTLDTTLAWGRNRHNPGNTTDGWLLEAALKPSATTTLFGRLERVENGELFDHADPLYDQVFAIKKLSIGAVHDVAQIGHARFGLGAVLSKYAKPSSLDNAYGNNPTSFMLFLRAQLK
jgi:hypothetical protein